jgi:hypothetical protein
MAGREETQVTFTLVAKSEMDMELALTAIEAVARLAQPGVKVKAEGWSNEVYGAGDDMGWGKL